jgi:hypothetical protein
MEQEKMTEKFTQGEWKIEERQAHCKGFELYGFAILTETKRICMCQTDDPENIPQMRANAALIAAAPQMYSKLKTVLALCEGGLLRKTRCDILGAEINQLLKKARGEE